MNLAPPPQTATILVVDDAPENIEVLGGVLAAHYEVRIAIDGRDALRQAFANPPNLILLDIMMPGIDGYEVCRRLKQNPATQAIPVIFVTALGQVENETQGFQAGCADYIAKPICPAVVEARVATHLALAEARRDLEHKNELLLHERALVEEVLRRTRALDRFDPRQLRYLMAPLEKTNGDILLAAFAPDGSQHVLLGDFTGHGLSAAIGSPVVADLFYSGVQAGIAAERLIQRINEVLHQVLPTGLFLASGYVAVAPDRRRLHLWNCGLPALLLLRGAALHGRYRSQSYACGLAESLACVSGGESIDVMPDDRLYAYSDGITDAVSVTDERYGEARLEQLLTHAPADASRVDHVQGALNAFTAGSPQRDDATLVELTL